MKLIFITLTLFLFGCSNTPKNVDNVSNDEPQPISAASIEAKQLAAEHEANSVIEVSFKKRSYALKPNSKIKIKALLSDIEKEKTIDEIKIISWSDQEYPSAEQNKLSDVQVKLARDRSEEIRTFIKTHNKKFKIDTMNMAERPGKLAELWGASDARLKKSLEDAGIPTSGESLKGPSKASLAIVMVLVKKK